MAILLMIREREASDSSFYAIVNQIPDDGQKTGRNMVSK